VIDAASSARTVRTVDTAAVTGDPVAEATQQNRQGAVELVAVAAAAGEGDPGRRVVRIDAPSLPGLDPERLVRDPFGMPSVQPQGRSPALLWPALPSRVEGNAPGPDSARTDGPTGAPRDALLHVAAFLAAAEKCARAADHPPDQVQRDPACKTTVDDEDGRTVAATTGAAAATRANAAPTAQASFLIVMTDPPRDRGRRNCCRAATTPI